MTSEFLWRNLNFLKHQKLFEVTFLKFSYPFSNYSGCKFWRLFASLGLAQPFLRALAVRARGVARGSAYARHQCLKLRVQNLNFRLRKKIADLFCRSFSLVTANQFSFEPRCHKVASSAKIWTNFWKMEIFWHVKFQRHFLTCPNFFGHFRNFFVCSL